MTAMIVTEWALMITLNGWIVNVDTFREPESCWEKQRIYVNATTQANSPVLAWCEKRTVKNQPVASNGQ